MSQIAPRSTPPAAPAGPSPPAPAPPISAPQPASNQRLVILESSEAGVYVYSLVDRATGNVLVQISREQAASMVNRKDDAAG